ncbi:hypothetical protein BSKO_05697 [Bryopsis sp. KO-2023]|nr:hypothetical protein BSKO_05697 [Bryopsis sp. KO-2023]
MATLKQRAYDPVYDGCYTVSGPRDHYREQSRSGGFLMEAMPDFGNFFSELAHHPSQSYRLKGDNRIPAHVDRNFQPSMTSIPELAMKSTAAQVSGTNRHKFFSRQLFAGLNDVAASTMGIPLSGSLESGLTNPANAEEEHIPKSRTIGIQSDYRESEAQTLPWDPEFRLPSRPSAKQEYRSSRFHCDGPEIAQLKHLTFGDGLPPGLNEIDHIDKLRAKRAFEASLPPLDDLANLPLRQKMIEEWESAEWGEREQEILGVQETRLALLKQAIDCREQRSEERIQELVKTRKEAIIGRMERTIAGIEKRRVKTVRHLDSERKLARVLRPQRKPSIVQKYGNYGSSAYAPLQRDGQFPDNRPAGKEIVTETFQPETVEEINSLEEHMAPYLREVVVKTKFQNARKPQGSRRHAEVQKDLDIMSDKLETTKKMAGLGYGDCWLCPVEKENDGNGQPARQTTSRIITRPRTPTVVTDHDASHAAIIVLQRLLRGRAVQDHMFEGLQRRDELVQELKLQESISKGTDICGSPMESSETRKLDAVVGDLVSQTLCALAAVKPSEDAENEVKP